MNNKKENQNFEQILVLDENFKLLKSNDTLFDTSYLSDVPVEKWFPFIESVYESIKEMETESNELEFLRVESPAEFLPGSYDFVFSKKNIDNKDYFVWCVFDYTEVYHLLSQYQQVKNERDIYRQKREFKYRNSSNLNDLFSP